MTNDETPTCLAVGCEDGSTPQHHQLSPARFKGIGNGFERDAAGALKILMRWAIQAQAIGFVGFGFHRQDAGLAVVQPSGAFPVRDGGKLGPSASP